jgi:small subunit ribosomal protein S21
MAKRINYEVRVRHGEPLERAIKKFMRKIKKEKILDEINRKRYYEKPSDKKRRLKKIADRKIAKQKAKEKQERES